MHAGPDERVPTRRSRLQSSVAVSEEKQERSTYPTGGLRRLPSLSQADLKSITQPTPGLRRLPALQQQDVEAAWAESPTRTFRAALRGLTPEQAEGLATRDTAPLPARGRQERQKPENAPRKSRQGMYYRLAMVVVALLILVGAGIPMLGMRFGVLAFDLNANGANTPMQASANAGFIEVQAPADSSMSGVAQIGTQPPSPTATTSQPPMSAATRPPAPTSAPRPNPTPQPTSAPPTTPSGPYSSWTPPPGYNSFAVTDFAGDPWAGSFGQCTWWAHHQRPDENLAGMGDAWNWANAARSRGLTVTTTPAPNATVVFAPGVQGASSLGHVSHVEKVLTGGWVLVSEMNFYWNGGGFARVDYRYVQAGPGVWFIH